jgi:hypothetical protein
MQVRRVDKSEHCRDGRPRQSNVPRTAAATATRSVSTSTSTSTTGDGCDESPCHDRHQYHVHGGDVSVMCLYSMPVVIQTEGWKD